MPSSPQQSPQEWRRYRMIPAASTSASVTHMGAAATEPTGAFSPARGAGGASCSAGVTSPALCFISTPAGAAAAAGCAQPATAPGRMLSTPPSPPLPPTPMSAEDLAAMVQAAFPSLGKPLGAGDIKVLVGGAVMHRAGRVDGLPQDSTLRQREVRYIKHAFAPGHSRPLASLARKSVTVCLKPAELRQALASSSPSAFKSLVQACVGEAMVCAEVVRRFKSCHGHKTLERWFPQQYGWSFEAVPEEEAGVGGCFRFVTYSAWQANGSLYRYLNKLRADRNPEWRTKAIQALTQWTHLCELLASAGITHGDMKMENLLVDENGNIKITDLDGAALLPAHILADAMEEAEACAAAAAAEGDSDASSAASASAAAVWRGLETAALSEAPYMTTQAFAPPEMWVGWVRSLLVSSSAADPLAPLRVRAEAWGWAGAQALLKRLDGAGCTTRVEQLQVLSDLGGRDWMCAASHTYLLGAAVCDWACEQLARLVPAVASAAAGAAEDVGFLCELHDVAEGLMALQPAQRPSMQALRRRLASLADDWC
ncbi:hypothetical protein HYH02_007150 [Chlamydomonas schloesseri]|uniref:Protein kinase domain-containing protein n=1 Tax=Chlamydomonas schloesseri TaxID=2026947 RepID=A0A835WIR2_9CHLO|nr:hypothetical protein HYH02_007150 [Chlamydomonas schloesseri]|eukprot:KAG2447690.1 hypothetical protein HYH02_007150 [Chlamydomonas schloesseri]